MTKVHYLMLISIKVKIDYFVSPSNSQQGHTSKFRRWKPSFRIRRVPQIFYCKKFSYCSTFIHQFSRIQILLRNIKNRIPLNKYSGSNIISDNLGNGPKYVRNYSTNFLMTTYFNLEDSLET